MIGQADSETIQSWLQLFSSMGVSGALVWYLISQAIPKMQDRFDASIKEQAKSAQEHSDRQAKTFEEHLKLLIEQNKYIAEQNNKAIMALTVSQEKQLDRIIEKFARCPITPVPFSKDNP